MSGRPVGNVVVGITAESEGPGVSAPMAPWRRRQRRCMDATLLIFDDVLDVCSPADANPGEPVPTRVTAADRRSQTGVRVLGVRSWAGRTAVRGTWVNVDHSLPPQVNPRSLDWALAPP